MAEFTVTPWKVEGPIDYQKLIKRFGTVPLDDKLKARLEKAVGKHLFLDRGIFFSHRDLDAVLKEKEAGKNIALYTGRGPSGGTHLGHLMPWLFTIQVNALSGASSRRIVRSSLGVVK